VVMETSDRGMLDIERFDLEPDRPIFHGFVGTIDPLSLRGLTTEQKVPYILKIVGEKTMSTRLRASLVEVDETVTGWPQLASAVSLGSGIAADAVRRILLKDHAPSGRYFFDFDTLAPRNIDGEPSQCAKLNSPKMQFLAEAPTGSITPNEKAIYSLVEKACR